MRAAAAFFVCILLVPHLSAAQPSGGAAPPSAYRKGSIDWEVYAGGALPVDLQSARSDRRLSLAAIEVGRIMSGPLGPGPISGQFEMLLQVMPIVVHGPEDFWGVGISPVFRWSFAGWKSLRPYAEVAAGLMMIDWEVPAARARRAEFQRADGRRPFESGTRPDAHWSSAIASSTSRTGPLVFQAPP